MMTNFINAGVATGKTRNAFATSFARFFETIEKSIILLSFANTLDHMIAFRYDPIEDSELVTKIPFIAELLLRLDRKDDIHYKSDRCIVCNNNFHTATETINVQAKKTSNGVRNQSPKPIDRIKNMYNLTKIRRILCTDRAIMTVIMDTLNDQDCRKDLAVGDENDLKKLVVHGILKMFK
jgi:hypothetical protein